MYMIIIVTDTICYMNHVTIKELSLCIFMLNKKFWVLSLESRLRGNCYSFATKIHDLWLCGYMIWCWFSFDYKPHCWCHVDSERLANFTVTVSDQKWPVTIDQLNNPKFTRCGQYDGVPPGYVRVMVTCFPAGILGRYVYIHSPNIQRIMTICEVEVGGGKLYGEVAHTVKSLI